MKHAGLYVHIPFCLRKCPYCDFYSVAADEKEKDEYLRALLRLPPGYGDYRFDTVYIGGGTPSVFGGDRLEELLFGLRRRFAVEPDAEITCECNPSSAGPQFFDSAARAGVNRISMGLQSAVGRERAALGRTGSGEPAAKAVHLARKTGIRNISLDVMLGIPGQTRETLRESLAFCAGLDVDHISAYMLKIEEGTPFAKRRDTLELPDEDTVAALYLFLCDYLKTLGYPQYEISNFAKEGSASKHNLKYWRCEEYLGLGAAAHSFMEGKRFYYPRSIAEFMKNTPPVFDSEGGGFDEYLMLGLRLTEGVSEKETLRRYGRGFGDRILFKAKKYADAGFMETAGGTLRLTPRGFLVSNTILADLLDDLR